ncbi:F-box family protein [Quillaja saponaria]|uniref:F-box family protein n=1 Tax=Quillaja saponaria TaxID=32244 RepID=A0AAD7L311_QUISA|nr:F-box family protein [Quillaja saponaria]
MQAVQLFYLSHGFSAWESLPTRQFSFHQTKPSRDQEKSEEEIEKFLDFVDESLSILSQYKVIVENFELKMFMCHCNEYTSRVDEWMSLLSRNCVKVLDIDFTGSIFSDTRKLFYSLPQTTFFIKSLVELRLKGCRFGKDILGDNVNFVSMRDLHLESASLDEQTVRTVEKLVNSCPQLEKFSLESDTDVGLFSIS